MEQKFGTSHLVKLKIKVFKKLLILILIFLPTLIVFAQNTPNCTNISGYVVSYPPLTQSQIDFINSEQQSQFPNAIKLDEPTSSYNCHNYAWVKRDGGSTFWLNTPGDDVFWTDNSYVQTSNNGEPDLRVSYQGDHTAVTLGNQNKAVSKWGSWGLYEHDITDVPAIYLPNNSLTYYKKNFGIEGASLFCTTANYTISNLPSGASVSWSLNPSSGIANLTTSGNTATLTGIGTGNVQLNANISTSCNVTVPLSSKNIYIGIPQITAINLSTATTSGYWCANSRGNYFDIELQGGLNPNGLTFQIQLLDPATYQVFANYTVSGGSGTFALTRPPYTTYLLQARVNDPSCGTSETWFGYEMEFVDCSNNYRVSSYNVYPNPANSDLTIKYAPVEESIAEKTTIKSKQKDIKLFNNKGEIMASSLMKENELKLVLDTKNIPDGTYFLHIIEGKETIKKQIIIKH